VGCPRADPAREQSSHSRSFSADSTDPAQASSSCPHLSLQGGSCCLSKPSAFSPSSIYPGGPSTRSSLFCLTSVHDNSSLCSSLPDSGRRAERNVLRDLRAVQLAGRKPPLRRAREKLLPWEGESAAQPRAGPGRWAGPRAAWHPPPTLNTGQLLSGLAGTSAFQGPVK